MVVVVAVVGYAEERIVEVVGAGGERTTAAPPWPGEGVQVEEHKVEGSQL